jgi:hypothetical protein
VGQAGGRFPVTLHQEQWLKPLAMSDRIKRFIEENRSLEIVGDR